MLSPLLRVSTGASTSREQDVVKMFSARETHSTPAFAREDCTSVHENGVALCSQRELVGGGFPLVEVLVEPGLAVVERLGVHYVHKACEQVCVLQQEVEVGKDELWRPAGTQLLQCHSGQHSSSSCSSLTWQGAA